MNGAMTLYAKRFVHKTNKISKINTITFNASKSKHYFFTTTHSGLTFIIFHFVHGLYRIFRVLPVTPFVVFWLDWSP